MSSTASGPPPASGSMANEVKAADVQVALSVDTNATAPSHRDHDGPGSGSGKGRNDDRDDGDARAAAGSSSGKFGAAPGLKERRLEAEELQALQAHAWHAVASPGEALAAAGSTPNGLSSDTAAQRLHAVGKNKMTPPKGISAWKRLFDQINSILIYILVAAGVASAVFEHYVDAGVIFAVVVVNVAIGFFMEGRAEKAAASLTQILANSAVVTRSGVTASVPAEDLTLGDVVALKAGDSVPADVRLLQASALQIEEAALTGEAAPVNKSVGGLAPDTLLADRCNMAYSGTSIMAGSGVGLVVAVGDACEVGKINRLVASVTATKTPLLVQLAVFGRWLSGAILIIGAAAFGVAMARELPVADAFNSAVGIAVAAIPEGLPSVITVILAIGVKKMARHNAIVRQLPSVETLGSVSVICSDKTGTLTQNAMAAVAVQSSHDLYRVSGSGYAPIGDIRVAEHRVSLTQRRRLLRLLLPGLLCNDAAVGQEPSHRPGSPTARRRWTATGNPTEASLLTLGMKVGFDSLTPLHNAFPRTATLPFDSQHKFMASLHTHAPPSAAGANVIRLNRDTVSRHTMDSVLRLSGAYMPVQRRGSSSAKAAEPAAGVEDVEARDALLDDVEALGDVAVDDAGNACQLLLVKGAPEVVLPFCAREMCSEDEGHDGHDADNGSASSSASHATRPLNEEYWRAKASELASEGLRVLALCSTTAPQEAQSLDVSSITGRAPFLTLHCLVGILDPPREQAIDAVARCQDAGIRVIMITGDHPVTACVIAGQLNIDNSAVATGADVDAASDEGLRDIVATTSVFARASPENKLRIVNALQARGAVAAMTGDGVNDSPALKAADIGVAMGITGTHVAKAASNMILADDNFATIVEAVRRGRVVYDNLKKVLLFVLPTNGGQSFSIFLSLVFGLEVPIVPVQILWVNLITSITLGVVLAFDPEDPGVMQRNPRRKGKRIIGQLLSWRLLYVSLLLSGAVIASFAWERSIDHSVGMARTVAVNTLTVCQAAYILNCRFMRKSSLKKDLLTGNPHLLTGLAAVAGFQALFTYVPGFEAVFETEAQDGMAWLRCFMFGAIVFVLVEIDKAVGPVLVKRVVQPLLCRRCCRSGCCRRKEEEEAVGGPRNNQHTVRFASAASEENTGAGQQGPGVVAGPAASAVDAV